MTRYVFFSFEYDHDVWRANVVRKSLLTHKTIPFKDSAEFEKIQKEGDDAIKKWINKQLSGTSVTVVLVGSHTCSSRWVHYEIKRSMELKKGLLQIDIGRIKDLNRDTSHCCGRMVSKEHRRYDWVKNNGYRHIREWIEEAAVQVGR